MRRAPPVQPLFVQKLSDEIRDPLVVEVGECGVGVAVHFKLRQMNHADVTAAAVKRFGNCFARMLESRQIFSLKI